MEVVVALGVIAFAVVLLLGLIPVGLQASRDSVQESEVVNILSTVLADRRASPADALSARFGLPAYKGQTNQLSGTILLADDGMPTTGTDPRASFRLDYRLFPPSGEFMPHLLLVRGSWPITGTASSGSVEMISSLPSQ